MTARERILSRIREKQHRASPISANLASPAHPRPKPDADPVARFKACALALTTTVDEVPTIDAAPQAIARYLDFHHLPRTAVCWPAFAGLAWAAAGIAVEVRDARGDDLVGITGAHCAIAETGTLMTVSGPDTPAAVSLLPETHIALITRGRILPAMEDAWALLIRERNRLPRAVNFISGPSRTADIEQTVSLGAHGPYRVHVVIVP